MDRLDYACSSRWTQQGWRKEKDNFERKAELRQQIRSFHPLCMLTTPADMINSLPVPTMIMLIVPRPPGRA